MISVAYLLEVRLTLCPPVGSWFDLTSFRLFLIWCSYLRLRVHLLRNSMRLKCRSLKISWDATGSLRLDQLLDDLTIRVSISCYILVSEERVINILLLILSRSHSCCQTLDIMRFVKCLAHTIMPLRHRTPSLIILVLSLILSHTLGRPTASPHRYMFGHGASHFLLKILHFCQLWLRISLMNDLLWHLHLLLRH